MGFLRASALVAAMALTGGCASSPPVTLGGDDPAHYGHWRCDAMHDEVDRVQQRAVDLALAADLRAGYGAVALGQGIEVFWPALRAMRPDGPDAVELVRLERRHLALREALAQRGCGPLRHATAAQLAPMLPLAPGERLVYEERTAARRTAGELALTLEVVRRGQLEFSASLDGRALPGAWVQDMAGNLRGAPATARGDAAPWAYWTQLLERSPRLGDVVTGELRHSGGGRARVRGQVIAQGVHTGFGRPFDFAAIELFGDVLGAPAGTRVDGVLVVDRGSGVLLRLELRSPDPGFDLRRTLLRIEGGG
ncbi:hypothetical protein MOJ79_04805 [Calidifontimicrobium sp. SYSU G02091]|uniref:hypothetical protein n=1 Tax=Calidifontimicrobium sp. SYSU G02091 TaxID=2926421 RepID=UPI001F53C635|nr:hypothetical protein [Calidifontimicrobium sp. SYSU G02091]MCI1191154.1 hypothetical protein [Calidifontimicrobium sp. SYSU G02091]